MPPRDLANAVLHAEGLVGGPERIAMVEVDFTLGRSVLDIRAFDLDEAVEASKQFAKGGLELVSLGERVALDAVGLRYGGIVDEVELDFRSDRRGVAKPSEAFDNATQDATGCGPNELSVMVFEVAGDQGDAISPGQATGRCEIGDQKKVGVAGLPAADLAAVEDIACVVPRQ